MDFTTKLDSVLSQLINCRGGVIYEGISWDPDTEQFEFNFETDAENDFIKLVWNGVHSGTFDGFTVHYGFAFTAPQEAFATQTKQREQELATTKASMAELPTTSVSKRLLDGLREVIAKQYLIPKMQSEAVKYLQNAFLTKAWQKWSGANRDDIARARSAILRINQDQPPGMAQDEIFGLVSGLLEPLQQRHAELATRRSGLRKSAMSAEFSRYNGQVKELLRAIRAHRIDDADFDRFIELAVYNFMSQVGEQAKYSLIILPQSRSRIAQELGNELSSWLGVPAIIGFAKNTNFRFDNTAFRQDGYNQDTVISKRGPVPVRAKDFLAAARAKGVSITNVLPKFRDYFSDVYYTTEPLRHASAGDALAGKRILVIDDVIQQGGTMIELMSLATEQCHPDRVDGYALLRLASSTSHEHG